MGQFSVMPQDVLLLLGLVDDSVVATTRSPANIEAVDLGVFRSSYLGLRIGFQHIRDTLGDGAEELRLGEEPIASPHGLHHSAGDSRHIDAGALVLFEEAVQRTQDDIIRGLLGSVDLGQHLGELPLAGFSVDLAVHSNGKGYDARLHARLLFPCHDDASLSCPCWAVKGSAGSLGFGFVSVKP